MANRLSEQYNIIYLIEPQDHQASGIDGDSFHVGRIHAFDIFVAFGALTGNSTMSLYSGATAGTKTTQEAWRYRLSGADVRSAGADVFGDFTAIAAGAALTLTAATYNDRLVVISMDSDQFTDGQPWITLEIDSTANPLNVSAVAICKTRFAANDPLTLIS